MDAHIVLVEGGEWDYPGMKPWMHTLCVEGGGEWDYLGMKPWMHTLCVWKEEGSVITFV